MASDIQNVCDYLILRCDAAKAPLNVLKLQKLLYYCQAWSLALGRGDMLHQKFQAWVHGPVSRVIYDRFAATKSLYSSVTVTDIANPKAAEAISPGDIQTINQVLETYAQFSGSELESMTHNEEPWILARNGRGEFERCETEIDEESMRLYYSSRLK